MQQARKLDLSFPQPAPQPFRAAPAADRNEALDVLRGLGVLVIFAVNIKAMGAPGSYYFSPAAWGRPLDFAIATFQNQFISERFFTLFTALFGCGLAMFTDRAREFQRGDGLIFRRLLFLLLIGLIHGYLIWFGDILVLYAVAGLVAVLFVRASTPTLYLASAGFFAIRMMVEFAAAAHRLPHGWAALIAGGPALTSAQESAYWLGDLGHQLQLRFLVFSHELGVHLGLNSWRVVAVMLAGMALYRQGFFNLRWKTSSYALAAVTALVLAGGEKVCALLMHPSEVSMFMMDAWATVRLLAIFIAAFGYASTVLVLLKLGLRLRPLARVGQMALSNYVACSIVGTTVFYGRGGHLFGVLSLAEMMMMVGMVWVVLTVFSMTWLSAYRFGPLEWVWRSLTYGRVQLLRKTWGSDGQV